MTGWLFVAFSYLDADNESRIEVEVRVVKQRKTRAVARSERLA
jgi:hypothetical protein